MRNFVAKAARKIAKGAGSHQKTQKSLRRKEAVEHSKQVAEIPAAKKAKGQ